MVLTSQPDPIYCGTDESGLYAWFPRDVIVTILGPVVQKPIKANLRLKINQGVLFLYSQLLFNGDTGQNFTSEEVNLEIQEEATETFTQKLETWNESLR